jgi:uncharacterized protein YjiS (DUF1127 family)
MTSTFTLTTLGTTLTAFPATVVRGVSGIGFAMVKAVQIAHAGYRAWVNRGPVLRMLEMDDRMLRDIGLTRADIGCALAGSPVSDPSTRLRIFAVERRAGNRAQAREQLEAMKTEAAKASGATAQVVVTD